MTGSMTVAVAFAVITYLAFHSVTLVEEAYLKRAFGKPYLDYMEEVPRFFPRFRLFHEGETLTVRPQLIYRTFTDGLLFLAAYPFFELVEYLQDTGVLPVFLWLY
jgi:hypothetical protein